jgi:hypothetical protein
MENGLPPCAREAPETDPCFGGGEPLGGAHGMIPVAAPAIRCLKTALNNLALAATNDTAVLQQVIAANLALTATIMSLTATNKKLVDAATCRGGTLAVTPGRGWTQAATPGWGWTQAATQAATPVATPGGIHGTKKSCPRNYCWTHGHRMSKHNTSATYANKAPGHRDDMTASNTFGSSNKHKNWNVAQQRALDGVGWLMLFIAILMICVKTIIALLYPHLLAVIPPTFLLPTQALPTPVSVASTLHLTPQWPTSTRRLPLLVSAWQTASQCGLSLALR